MLGIAVCWLIMLNDYPQSLTNVDILGQGNLNLVSEKSGNFISIISFNQRIIAILTAYSMLADRGSQVPRSKDVPVYNGTLNLLNKIKKNVSPSTVSNASHLSSCLSSWPHLINSYVNIKISTFLYLKR